MSQNYHGNIRHDIIPLVPKVGRLLDVGGGTGATARHLKSIGRAEEIGVLDAVVDIDTNELDFTSNVDLDDEFAIEESLSKEAPFDAILLLDVLEHLRDPWSRVDQFARHLAPNGQLIASIPNVRHVSILANLILRDDWRYADSGLLDRTHIRFFTRRTAIELLERPGLSIEQIVASPIGAPKQRMFNRLTFGRFKSFFTLQHFVVARRDASGHVPSQDIA